MASIDAKNVAKEVLETIGKGKKVVLGKIAIKNGYAKNTADSPKLITETDSYKEIIDPVVNKWIRERDRLTKELESRDLTEEKYETIIRSVDLITKNIQLLSGGNTSKILITGLTLEEQNKLRELNNDNETSPREDDVGNAG
jgi:hypothetical protein